MKINKQSMREAGIIIMFFGGLMIGLSFLEIPNPFALLGATMMGVGIANLAKEIARYMQKTKSEFGQS